MSGRRLFLWILLLIALYFFYQNFDFETKTLRTSDKLIRHGFGTSQQAEYAKVRNNL